jgi:hypothetical protein
MSQPSIRSTLPEGGQGCWGRGAGCWGGGGGRGGGRGGAGALSPRCRLPSTAAGLILGSGGGSGGAPRRGVGATGYPSRRYMGFLGPARARTPARPRRARAAPVPRPSPRARDVGVELCGAGDGGPQDVVPLCARRGPPPGPRRLRRGARRGRGGKQHDGRDRQGHDRRPGRRAGRAAGRHFARAGGWAAGARAYTPRDVKKVLGRPHDPNPKSPGRRPRGSRQGAGVRRRHQPSRPPRRPSCGPRRVARGARTRALRRGPPRSRRAYKVARDHGAAQGKRHARYPARRLGAGGSRSSRAGGCLLGSWRCAPGAAPLPWQSLPLSRLRQPVTQRGREVRRTHALASAARARLGRRRPRRRRCCRRRPACA